MKLRNSSILISVLAMAGTANAAEVFNKDQTTLDVYGEVHGMHYQSKDESNQGDRSHARLGLRGNSQINSQLSAYGRWEYEAKLNNAEAGDGNGQHTRLGYAGLKFGTEGGTFDYGRNYGVMHDVAAMTDVLPEFGGDSFQKPDSFMTRRGTGMATYRNDNFFGLVEGLHFALQFQGRNDKTGSNRNLLGANGDGYGMSLSYDITDTLSAAAAFSSSRLTAGQKQHLNIEGDRANSYAAGLKYDDEALYLAAIYNQSSHMTRIGNGAAIDGLPAFAPKSENLEVVAKYTFDFGLTPMVAFVQSTGKATAFDGQKVSGALKKYAVVGTNFAFNKNMSAFAMYQFNLIKSSEADKAIGIASDDIMAVGMLYKF